MTKKSKKLVETFDAFAQSWGWQSDQGVGSTMAKSEALYKTAKGRLIKHIEELETELWATRKAAEIQGVIIKSEAQIRKGK